MLPATGGGRAPHWRADGKELFCVYGTKLKAVEVKPSGSAIEPGVPEVLFEAPSILEYDPAPDGQRFLLLSDVDNQKGAPPFTVLLNW
jgi:hypothetical protein